MKKIITTTEKETFAWGLKLGRQCRGGEVFALCGELGAGKTKLAQGIAAGLGVTGRVNSPTFNILKVYKIDQSKTKKTPVRTFCHIDAYRLQSERDLQALGVEEIFVSPDTVTAIEWGEKAVGILPLRTQIIGLKSLDQKCRQVIIV
ncbi:TPA: tRNA (adenosine(37)-N6)-threonylcarbamoyltransferase complex ATPase subunit type 1 TsaE [Candidatus Falkowbacteria bacterium]|jgi:tRNA threonylcarbamoyladenosine biosynthesis protein TsaE|nr:MAG: ATPase, YjeE family [Candidatus Falkowbacteria bacterium GW2011_GWF2_43_32]HBA37040.1 tRNA (adenosine(37)-N6)-threonylcarbamoyltransferase complex ATPase subunit type 1 TsaE [Candidatus Falkowbacteria bacterium]